MNSLKNSMGIKGKVTLTLCGPDGKVKYHGSTHNLITDVGDNYFSSQVYAAAGTSNFKLGSATTAVTKNGAGSFVATADYITGSAHACDASSPKVGASANILHYEHTWAAGEGTGTLNRVGLTDNATNAGEADATHTYAMALLPDKPITKGASDTLKVEWDMTFLGA